MNNCNLNRYPGHSISVTAFSFSPFNLQRLLPFWEKSHIQDKIYLAFKLNPKHKVGITFHFHPISHTTALLKHNCYLYDNNLSFCISNHFQELHYQQPSLNLHARSFHHLLHQVIILSNISNYI